MVPPDDKVLVPKCCKLIANLLNTQKLSIEGRTLKVCTEWILQTLKQNPESLTEALIALDSLLNNHKENLQMVSTIFSSVMLIIILVDSFSTFGKWITFFFSNKRKSFGCCIVYCKVPRIMYRAL